MKTRNEITERIKNALEKSGKNVSNIEYTGSLNSRDMYTITVDGVTEKYRYTQTNIGKIKWTLFKVNE